MCCEDCPKYKSCEENDFLKEDCCPKCQDYYDCVGMYEDDNSKEEAI